MGASELLRDCIERLSHRPDDPEVATVLEGLLGTEVSLEAARLLVKALEPTQNFDGLIRALDAVAVASKESPEKISALTRIAEVYRQRLRQPDLALAALAKALELAPGDGALHGEAEAVALEADAVDVLIELLSDLLEPSSTEAQVALRKTLAVLHKRSNADHHVATEHLRAALSVAPNDLEILSVLRRDHEQREE